MNSNNEYKRGLWQGIAITLIIEIVLVLLVFLFTS